MASRNRLHAVVWRLCVLIGLLACGPLRSEESWPHLPSDDEIAAARDRLVEELSFQSLSCTEKAALCRPDPDEIARQVCLAQACINACRMGPETRKSRLSDIELIKAHHPADPSARSAHVFALIKVERTRDDCSGNLSDEVEYATKMLEFNLIADKVPAGAPSAMHRDWVFLSEGIDYGVFQSDASSRTERDLVIASYFEPGRLLRGFPGEAKVADSYRISSFIPDSRHPLRFVVELERRVAPPADADPDAEPLFRPAPNVRIDVSALRHQGNEQRLAGYFETLQCRNCESSEIHGHSAQWLTDASQPIFLLTDVNGQVAIEFFLEFGALTQSRALAPGAQIKVPVQFTARAAVANGPLKAVAQKQEVATLDAIGVVEAVTYEPPQLFEPLSGDALPRGLEAPLYGYLDDAGTSDGPRTLTGVERVIVKRVGEAGIGASGSTPGRTLDRMHTLQVGDRITVNACGMVSNRTENGLPVGDAGRIWVTLRYFDGLIGKFGVSGKVCRGAMNIGTSGKNSGFLSDGTRFVYWAGGNGIEAALVWLYPPLAVASYTRKVIKGLGWLGDNNSVYVVLQSAVTVEFDDDGAMQISTREGEPRIYTGQTSAEGLIVPASMSARVIADGSAEVQPTDADRSARADAWLAGLDAQTSSGSMTDSLIDPNAPEEYAAPAVATSGVEDDDLDWTVVIAVALPVMLLVVWIGRRRVRGAAGNAHPVRPSTPAKPAKQAQAAAAIEKRHVPAGAKAVVTDAAQRFCAQCGQAHSPGAKFCSGCGAAFGNP